MKTNLLLSYAPRREDVAPDGGKRSTSRPGRFTLGEKAPDTHWIGVCVGPRAGLDTEAKAKAKIPSPPLQEMNSGRPVRSL
jgi:hypothetical protein